jgi:hypothetical protein
MEDSLDRINGLKGSRRSKVCESLPASDERLALLPAPNHHEMAKSTAETHHWNICRMHHSGTNLPNRAQRRLALLPLLAVVIGLAGNPRLADGQHVPGIKYADQPTGIELSAYAATWPALKPYVLRLQASQGATVLADLKQRALAPGVSDGELNLLAQLEWQHGELEAAETAITRAAALQPNQPAHAFQQAMISFAHLRRASGMMDRWKWQRRTRDAYQHTFDLDPRNPSARYYLA